MAKVVVNSNRGDRMLIEVDSGEKTWYFLGDKVKSFAQSLKENDTIDFKHQIVNGKKTITFITKTGVVSQPKPATPPPTKGTENTRVPDPREQEKKEKIKSENDRVDSIVRQTAAKCASMTMGALAGQVSSDEIVNEWNKVYDNIYKKITE